MTFTPLDAKRSQNPDPFETERVGPGKLNQSPGVDVLEWYHLIVWIGEWKKPRNGEPPAQASQNQSYAEGLELPRVPSKPLGNLGTDWERPMAHIPKGAIWYVAELVEQITVEGDSRNVLHKNMILIRADSPESAYQKALAIGKENELSYANPAGKLVEIAFRGLSELNVVHDELDHGAELAYEEQIGLSNEEIEKCVRSREELGVFRPPEPPNGPDCSSKEIVDDARKLMTRTE